MKRQQAMLGFIGVFFLLLSGPLMADEDNDTSDKNEKQSTFKKSGYAKISRMAKSMGGLEKILSLETLQFSAEGTRHEPEQSKIPGGEFIHVLDYNYTLLNGLTKQVSKTDWFHDGDFPFIQQRQFTEIINGDQGAVLGFDTVISPAQAPMRSTRIGARVKQNLLSSPLALVHRASQYAQQVKFIGVRKYNGRVHQVVSLPGWDQPIRVYIDAVSKLPSKAETLEDDSVYGDTHWEVIYSNWAVVNGIQVPTNLIHKLNGRVINEENRTSFQLGKTLKPAMFAIPDELKSEFNPDQFAWGIRSSQWFNRTLSFGIPFDLDQRTTAALEIVEVADKVYHFRAFTHHSVVIEMNDFLIVADAPLYDERSQIVLSAIKQHWPNKPVKYLISSHFHNDHIGGIRGYGAEGATLIVGEGTKEHYEEIFEAPHTVHPDVYSTKQNEVKIKTVSADEDYVITDGTRTVRVVDVENRHAIGMLMPFIEDVNMVFVSDLYNPDFFPTSIPKRFVFWSEDLLNALKDSELDIKWMVGAHGGVSSFEQFVNQVEASL